MAHLLLLVQLLVQENKNEELYLMSLVSNKWRLIITTHGIFKSKLLFMAGNKGYVGLCYFVKELGWNVILEYMLNGAADGGHEHLCRLAKEWGAMNFNEMLGSAAKKGHENLCRLAKEWGATDFNYMLYYAAEGGHEDICRLAKEWGAWAFEKMLKYAGRSEQETFIQLALKLGTWDHSVLQKSAEYVKYDTIIRLAKEWIAERENKKRRLE